MLTITTHEAKTHLSRYLVAVERGEEIVIARGRKPVARLVPVVGDGGMPRPKVGEVIDEPCHVPEEALAPVEGPDLKEWGL
jgi:prevent-host-death family protein